MSKLYIPIDIVYCILARLSVKDLMKLKCVSKLWLSTIQSPEFIKLHMIFNSKSQKLICANLVPDGNRRYGFYSTVSGFLPFPEMFVGDQKSISLEEIQCPGLFYGNHYVVGISRGILCIVYTKGKGLYLYNPWIKECKRLPRTHLESFPKERDWFYNVYGFGYDELNDDFKVVKFSGVKNKFVPETCTFTNEGKIYSFKSNKWKSIKNIPHQTMYGSSGFLFNHYLHWIFRFDKTSFLSVDIRTGEHTLLPLPDNFKNDIYLNTRDLGEFNGCLCISKGVINGFEIWLMKDYGVKDSWTKLEVFVFVPAIFFSIEDSRLIRYTKNENEEQLIFTFGEVLYLFDFHDKKLYSRENVVAYNYFFSIETLVRLCRIDKRESSSRRSLYKRKRS